MPGSTDSTFTGNVRIKGSLDVEGTATVDALLTCFGGLCGRGGAAGQGAAISGPITHIDGTPSSNDITLSSRLELRTAGKA